MLNVDDHVCDKQFGIDGLKFESNSVVEISGPGGWFTKKLMSSEGPLISDFVTHESNFQYSTYGIHVGQDDRLTFMGENGKLIHGYFVDCRQGSSTLHKLVALEFAPSVHRRLIIPRGVAHTFDNLEHIVTRDEPIWYSDTNNPAWNIDNDLISVIRNIKLDLFPIIQVNKHRLPDDGHLFLSKLSQALLDKPKSYLARYPVKIGATEQFIMLEPKTWGDDANELERLLNVPTIPGVEVRRNRYALTGPSSWTLVPNTSACVADILHLPTAIDENIINKTKYLHARTKKCYTLLNHQGLDIEFEFVDLRNDSETFGVSSRLKITCDPRINITIENGIAYSIRCAKNVLVRCEHEVFVDENEPRSDIPMFNNDLILITDDILEYGLQRPKIRCPDSVVYQMAKLEQQMEITE
ncbi:hypothetical protein Xmau_03087 [Xenorhabdus mauleonii]|uniref:dTDP-4-dehydrorhamnose 3,5-epimerase n=1 Tax=Xenorhabdus mauleonii TaxID=351675 RepID=A0A1I3SK73_9GAMM|nr:dTDP-4-dehydrorhamnose 3,5-epimerase family protein [Xenorhabdus mauleonii]PHM39180.1 hypothetical protein Xmau_03087 [Xenorhabdus mauleonii]SFJ57846.1 dTDP-4-dehydrorhamnose 3,5-epimerase [Xenorhabdus mauleonii]